MKKQHAFLKFAAFAMLVSGAFVGCESTDGGGSTSVSMYYGVGWYNSGYYYGGDNDIIVTPPPRPDRPDNSPKPSHPIAVPPSTATPTPAPRPMPSIPSTPRPMARPAGRR